MPDRRTWRHCNYCGENCYAGIHRDRIPISRKLESQKSIFANPPMIQSDRIHSLPVALGARLVLDSISYSNPLPPWSEAIVQNFATEESVIRNRIGQYLDGQAPSKSFTIAVPKKSGDKKFWHLPSV